MLRYRNLGGNSNIYGFEISDDRIQVVFKSGKFKNYIYSYSRPGKLHVDRMKQLAVNGKGLNSYISRIVKQNYFSKW